MLGDKVWDNADANEGEDCKATNLPEGIDGAAHEVLKQSWQVNMVFSPWIPCSTSQQTAACCYSPFRIWVIGRIWIHPCKLCLPSISTRTLRPWHRATWSPQHWVSLTSSIPRVLRFPFLGGHPHILNLVNILTAHSRSTPKLDIHQITRKCWTLIFEFILSHWYIKYIHFGISRSTITFCWVYTATIVFHRFIIFIISTSILDDLRLFPRSHIHTRNVNLVIKLLLRFCQRYFC